MQVIGPYSLNTYLYPFPFTYPLRKKFEDIGTTYKLIEQSQKIVYTNSKLYGYLIRKNSITNTFQKDNILDYEEMIETRYQELLPKYPELKKYLDANKVKSIVRQHQNISMFSSKELLKEEEINHLLEYNHKRLKEYNTKEVKKLNSSKINLLSTTLLINKKLFYFLTKVYYNTKKWRYK